LAVNEEKEQNVYELNEIVTMKKQHPCGGNEWKIVRVGADVKLQCVTCGKYVNMTRDEITKRAKSTRTEVAN
jgi:hypothetical protein